MKSTGYQEAVLAYQGSLETLVYKPITTGLINQSWRISNASETFSFFLQQINTQVFPHAEGIQQNYLLLWEAFCQQEAIFKIPKPFLFKSGAPLFTDSQGGQWRVSEWLGNTTTLTVPSSSEQVKKVAAVFGNFTKTFASLNTDLLLPSIHQFHNLSLRFSQFQDACLMGISNRITETAALIEALQKRECYVNRFEEMRLSPQDFPLRVHHHDAKISNLLFDKKGQDVVAVIDLDTTMPGLYFSDLGDMIRSMAGTEGENSTNWNSLQIDPTKYQALVEGYQEAMQDMFTQAEKEWIHYAGLLMLYMQALRFLTDYLKGDHYYKTDRMGQNRDRANNQLFLLISLENLLEKEYRFPL